MRGLSVYLKGWYARLFGQRAIGDLFIFFLSVLSIVGFIITIISFFFVGAKKWSFEQLSLLFLCLWFLWGICALLFINRKRFLRLLSLWALIDVSVLLFFLSLSMGISNWERSIGADIVVYTTYYPFILAINIIDRLVPITFINALSAFRNMLVVPFPAFIRGGLDIWLPFSLLAIVQSVGIVCIAILVKTLLVRRKKGRQPLTSEK